MKEIIPYKALDRLAIQTGITGKWKPVHKEIDGEIDLYLQGTELHLFAEVKTELREYQLPDILKIADVYRPLMVIAENIFPKLKAILREKGVSYLDTAGNIYINTDNNYIWIDGNKAVNEEKPVKNRAFTTTGLKTLFYLLQDNNAINLPHRHLANITKVALGNITNVIEGLRNAGFILQVNDKTLKIHNKRALLERWITGYGEKLKPTLHMGNFQFWEKDKMANWRSLPVEQGSVWGGEPAAEEMTNYLRPAFLTLYTEENRAAIIPNWALIPAQNGNVRLYKKFWLDLQPTRLAPPLLVYTDLILTGDPRCLETAEKIYLKYLKDEFEPNKGG